MALPRATRSGVASTLRCGTGALRACSLTIPAIASVLANDTATASTAASPTPPHFRALLLICQEARMTAQTSNAVAATIDTRPRILSMCVIRVLPGLALRSLSAHVLHAAYASTFPTGKYVVDARR